MSLKPRYLRLNRRANLGPNLFTLGLNTEPMYTDNVYLSDALKANHTMSWQQIAQPGDFWSAAERVAIVNEARASLQCSLCARRKEALSPYASKGNHSHRATKGVLSDIAIDSIHRIRTDPGRLTREWFDSMMAAGLSQQAYAELISVITSSVIIDTLHNSLGLDVPDTLPPESGECTHKFNQETVDEGGWLPMLAAPRDIAEHGLPEVPNIARALGLVPSALNLYFQTFRSHYALQDIDLSISQAQAARKTATTTTPAR